MSRATKRKHVVNETKEDISLPTQSQTIVQVTASKGNNLHEVREASGNTYLVSMPTKYRKNIWIKRGDYVLVEPIAEGDKVKAEITRILTKDHIKFYQSSNCWPQEFGKPSVSFSQGDGDDDIFVNTNRRPQNHDTTDTESETSSEASDSD